MTNDQYRNIIALIEKYVGEGEAYELIVRTVNGQFTGTCNMVGMGLLCVKEREGGPTWINLEMVVAISLGEPL
jgi:hypothetical protein